MAIIDITTKECVENISEDDTIFVTHQGHLMQIKKSDLHDVSKLNINQGIDNVGKTLAINSDGDIEPSEFPIDQTLSVEGQAADSKKVGDKFNIVQNELNNKANISDIPKKLPNEFKLKFSGAIEEEYDGSSEKTINIPEKTDISNTPVSFSEAEDCSNIDTNETVATIFGKIKKIFNSIKLVAFSNDYNDLLNSPSVMIGATSDSSGSQGFVPAPNSGDENSYLKGDGTWSTIDNESIDVMEGATDSTDGTSGLVPSPSSSSKDMFLKGDATWGNPTTKIYENKLVTLDEIDLVTEQGFFVDALAVKQLNSKVLQYNTYSTNETLIGTMQDGTLVYRKIIKTPMTEFTAQSSGYQSLFIETGVLIKDLLSINVQLVGGGTTWVLPYSGTGAWDTWFHSIAKVGIQTSMKFMNRTAWGSSYNIFAVLVYTK